MIIGIRIGGGFLDQVKFDINTILDKLDESRGEKEVILTAQEAEELSDYLEYVRWRLNKPEIRGIKGYIMRWLS